MENTLYNSIIVQVAPPEIRKIYPFYQNAYEYYFKNFQSYLNPIDLHKFISYIDPFEIFSSLYLDNQYCISNFGRIYSLKSNMLLAQHITTDGYYQLSLHINSKRHSYKVHRLLMMTFAYRPDYQYLEINHLNGNKLQNVFYPGHPLHNLVGVHIKKTFIMHVSQD